MTVLVWLLAAVFCMGLAMLLGRPAEHTVDFITFPPFFFIFVTVIGTSLGLLLRSPHWIRLSAAGMEIGTTNARAVLIPWSNVESATVRGRSVLAHLDVVPRRAALCHGHASTAPHSLVSRDPGVVTLRCCRRVA